MVTTDGGTDEDSRLITVSSNTSTAEGGAHVFAASARVYGHYCAMTYSYCWDSITHRPPLAAQGETFIFIPFYILSPATSVQPTRGVGGVLGCRGGRRGEGRGELAQSRRRDCGKRGGTAGDGDVI